MKEKICDYVIRKYGFENWKTMFVCMLEKILSEMIEKGTVIDRYSQDNGNGKYYTYYEIEYNGETFEVMCVNGECKSIEKM